VDLEDSINEVFRKIGGNIILFQRLEYLLKFVIANGNFSGYVSELGDKKAKRTAYINKQTMGWLVGQYIESSNPSREEFSCEPEELKDMYISFRTRIECDSVYYETKKEALAIMVSERNELVHHLLPSFDMKSAKSCEEIESKLDNQADKIRSEIKELEATGRLIHEGRKKFIDYLNSREFELSFLRQSRLVHLLGHIANQIGRPDGWTLMSIAGQLIKQNAPEELALLKEEFGHKSLMSLILATELFDVYEEPTEKGGIRVLYKLKSGWKLIYA